MLRSLLGAILATRRTNYYQTGDDGKPKSYLSFKFDPKMVLELPEPRPMFEIFVYSPRVEVICIDPGDLFSDRRYGLAGHPSANQYSASGKCLR
ncbi:MAG: NAD-glutamate dehydrogenase domain-containing protein [Hyphomicrobiales bacterium]